MAKKNNDLNLKDMLSLKPIGDNQKVVFDTWDKVKINLFLALPEQVKHLFYYTKHFKTF